MIRRNSSDSELLAFIDSLRALAIIMVVLVHSEKWSHAINPLIRHICLNGARGVQLFFVISAFTLFLSATRREGTEHAPILNFIVRRFFRIAPLFYLAIVFYSYLYGIDWKAVLLTATFTHGWRPETISSAVPGGWAIAVEVSFYILFPFIVRILRSIEHAWAFLIASVCIRILSQIFLLPFFMIQPSAGSEYLNSVFGFQWFPNQLPVFALGILAYFLFAEQRQSVNMQLGYAYLSVSFALAVSALHWSTMADIFPQHLAYGMSFLFLALGLFHTNWPFLVNSLFTFIGRRSYELYLTHFAVIDLFKHIRPDGLIPGSHLSTPLGFFLVFGCSLIIASMLSAIVEKQSVRIIKRLTGKIERIYEKKHGVGPFGC